MNKDSYLYTIVFTFVLTAAFGTLLAATQSAYLPSITENELNVERAAVLKVLGIEVDGDLAEVFDEQIVPAQVGDLSIHTVRDADGQPVSYAFPFTGQGLWGSIRGFIGVSAGFDTLLGIEFVEQNETPGLGGRIDEAWFKEQFQDIPLTVGEDLVYGEEIDAITGATSSSNAVLNILNHTIADIMPLQEVLADDQES